MAPAKRVSAEGLPSCANVLSPPFCEPKLQRCRQMRQHGRHAQQHCQDNRQRRKLRARMEKDLVVIVLAETAVGEKEEWNHPA
eukprot:2957251-Rhodomonas_salina.4